jgi:hypothetical protein
MRPSNKEEREAAFDRVLSELGAESGPTDKVTADWVRNEFEIFLVALSLGGAYAAGALVGLTDNFLGLHHASQLCEACLAIEKSPKLQQVAERIVLTWISELAAGKPIDSRLYVLIAEWCRQRLEPTAPGRSQDSPIKRLAIVSRLIEVAAKYPTNAYGAKKQIYRDLENKFGLKRSQLSKLIKGFDPRKFIKNRASDKSN